MKPCRSQFSLRPKIERPCAAGRYPWSSSRSSAIAYLRHSAGDLYHVERRQR